MVLRLVGSTPDRELLVKSREVSAVSNESDADSVPVRLFTLSERALPIKLQGIIKKWSEVYSLASELLAGAHEQRRRHTPDVTGIGGCTLDPVPAVAARIAAEGIV